MCAKDYICVFITKNNWIVNTNSNFYVIFLQQHITVHIDSPVANHQVKSKYLTLTFFLHTISVCNSNKHTCMSLSVSQGLKLALIKCKWEKHLYYTSKHVRVKIIHIPNIWKEFVSDPTSLLDKWKTPC